MSFYSTLFGKKKKKETWKHNKIFNSKPSAATGALNLLLVEQSDLYAKYGIGGELGHGGFGRVFSVYFHIVEGNERYGQIALKTFRDEFLNDKKIKDLFRREANIWIEFSLHPNILKAFFVEEIAGRLHIAIQYIPKNEKGWNKLSDYLEYDVPDLSRNLRWAIQVCYGMEYAYSKGLRCHRDLKPDNIMITPNEIPKITDFGLSGVLDHSEAAHETRISNRAGRIGLSSSIIKGGGCGTPTHMPPEQFINAAKFDERSDLYSFGVILYQMAAGGRLPFQATWPEDNSEEEQMRFGREMYIQHSKAPVPKINSPLSAIFQRCLEKDPFQRYPSFKDLRKDLESLRFHLTNEVVNPPKLEEPDAFFWFNRGLSLNGLNQFEQASASFDNALELDPKNSRALLQKGISLNSLGLYKMAISCFDKILESRRYGYVCANAWNNKGRTLCILEKYNEAIECFKEAICHNPQLDLLYIFNLGYALYHTGKKLEAANFFNKFIGRVSSCDDIVKTSFSQQIEYAKKKLLYLE